MKSPLTTSLLQTIGKSSNTNEKYTRCEINTNKNNVIPYDNLKIK